MAYENLATRAAVGRHLDKALSAAFVDNGEVLRLLVVFQLDEDGWEVASCPTLPGCHSQGRTREEALDNVQER